MCVIFTFSTNIQHPEIPDDELIFEFLESGSSQFSFVEIFDTSSDGESGGRVRLGSGLNNGIGTQSLIFVINSVRPGAAISVFIALYFEDIYLGGQSFLAGRMAPGLQPLY